LVVLCAVVGGLVGGPQRGTVAGFVFGLVYDLALTTPFGLWPLVLCVTGFVVGLSRNEAIRDNRWLQTSIVFLASAAAVVAYAGVATVFGSEGVLTLRVVPTALVVALVNAALTRPAMRVMRFALLAGDRRPV
jgi:rod shape-determining protein MreD